MPSIFSRESIPVADKIISIVRSNPSGIDGDPALEALHWGQLIEIVINKDPENIGMYAQYAEDEGAQVEFQLVGLLAPFLLEFPVAERAFIAHYMLNDIDDEHFDRTMQKLQKDEASNK